MDDLSVDLVISDIKERFKVSYGGVFKILSKTYDVSKPLLKIVDG